MKKFDPIRVKSFEEFKKDFMESYAGQYYVRTIDGVPFANGFEIDPIRWEDSEDFCYDPNLTVEDVKKAYCDASPEIIRERYEKYLEWCRDDDEEEDEEEDHPDYEDWFRETYCSQ